MDKSVHGFPPNNCCPSSDWCRESPSDQSASSFRSGSHALRNNDWDAASHQSIDRSGRSSYQFMDESRNRRDSFGSQSASWGAVCGSMAAQSNNPVTVPRSRGAQGQFDSSLNLMFVIFLQPIKDL